MSLAYIDAVALVEESGPFQGEEPWVPLACENLDNGMMEIADFQTSNSVSWATVDDDDREWWHLKPETVALSLAIDNEGFVHGAQMNEQEFAQFKNEIQEDQEK